MHTSVKVAARGAFRFVGLEQSARHAWAKRNRIGRRNARDDRQLAFFLRATLSPTSNCIDIGAASGEILREIVRMAPHGRHMAFEPRPRAVAALESEFPHVDLRAVALSDRTGEAEFHIADLPEYSGLQQRPWLNIRYETITVPVERLDDLIPVDLSIQFVKIDVEGAEVRVLRGAHRMLADHHPSIWIEHGARSADAHDTTRVDLWNILTDHDYRLFTADGEGPLSWHAFDSARIKAVWSFMAHR